MEKKMEKSIIMEGKMDKTVKIADISPLLEWRKGMEKIINKGENLLMKMENMFSMDTVILVQVIL